MRHLKTIICFIAVFSLGFAVVPSGFAEDEVEFIPGEDSGFYYTIKKGDTLWDLSNKFYNSEWDWPGLWQINKDIKNPHWIYPGKKIRVYLKDYSKIKPIVVPVKKVAKPKKPEKIKPKFSYSEMDSIAFLKEKQVPSLGSILKEQDGNLLISDGDIIYIKPSSPGSLAPGRSYHVFKPSPVKQEIKSKKEDVEPEIFQGIKHIINAKITIIADKGDYLTARVTDGYRTVHVGDLIMDYYEREKILNVENDVPSITARIVGEVDDAQMINDYFIAFINVGRDTVKAGDMYTVMRENKIPEDKLKFWKSKKEKEKQIQLENLESGKLIVLHTEDISSTVMILNSAYAIHPNDLVN